MNTTDQTFLERLDDLLVYAKSNGGKVGKEEAILFFDDKPTTSQAAQVYDALKNEDISVYDDSLNIDKDMPSSLSMYINEISKYPLLSDEEVQKLAKQVFEWQALSGEESKKNEEIIKNGKAAKDKLVKHNLRLVIGVAKYYKTQNTDLMDLIQEGNIGLMRGIEKYDYRKGYKISTYCTWHIRTTIEKALAYTGSAVKLPFAVAIDKFKINKAIVLAMRETGQVPTTEEISEKTGIKPEDVKRINNLTQNVMSLNITLKDDNDTEFISCIADNKSKSIEEIAEDIDKRERIIELLESVLDERQTQIIMMRFGFNDEERIYKLADIAKIFGTSNQAIQQAEKAALKKLRNSADIKSIKDYIAY